MSSTHKGVSTFRLLQIKKGKLSLTSDQGREQDLRNRVAVSGAFNYSLVIVSKSQHILSIRAFS